MQEEKNNDVIGIIAVAGIAGLMGFLAYKTLSGNFSFFSGVPCCLGSYNTKWMGSSSLYPYKRITNAK